MKPNRSIRSKLFRYLIGFVAVIITTLFLVQTVFLEDFYKIIKKGEIKNMAVSILENVDEDGIEDYIDDNIYRGEMCIHVVVDGKIVLSSDRFKDCSVRKMTEAELTALYKATLEKPGKDQSMITLSSRKFSNFKTDATFDEPRHEQMMYVLADDDAMVIIESMLTPMTATISVLRVQLFYATGILIVAAGILAYILSKKIAQPIIDINRSAKKLISGGYDLTLSDKAYREIVELNDTILHTSVELKKADRMQKELIANISHDLRTPLSMIIGYSEMMRDLPNENNQENVQVIIDEAQRLSRLVNDILDISKTNASLDNLSLEETNLTALVGEIVDRCSKMTEVDGYVFEFDAKESAIVLADASKISQAIYNMIGNAISHTGEDKRIIVRQEIRKENLSRSGEKNNGVSSKIASHEEAKSDKKSKKHDKKPKGASEKSFVRISITDTGEGIAPEHLENIWDRYYKVDKNHIRATVGTGLGLSIVKNIVTAHHGSCGVQSELGKGSSFWIELPIVKQ